MFTSVFDNVLVPAMSAVVSWFTRIADSLGGFSSVFLAFFFIFSVYRFLIAPLMRGRHAGSDKVRTNKNDSSSKTQSDNMEG